MEIEPNSGNRTGVKADSWVKWSDRQKMEPLFSGKGVRGERFCCTAIHGLQRSFEHMQCVLQALACGTQVVPIGRYSR